jgi:hypothetical protein
LFLEGTLVGTEVFVIALRARAARPPPQALPLHVLKGRSAHTDVIVPEIDRDCVKQTRFLPEDG